MKMKHLLICIMALAMTVAVKAQEMERTHTSYPHGFVEAYGGVRTVHSDLFDFNLLKPSVQLAVGGYVNRYFGMRLAANGLWGKGATDSGSTYDYKVFNGDIDLLFDITNLFRKTDANRFHFILFAGGGMQNTWAYDAAGLPEADFNKYGAYLKDNHITAHARVGAQFKVVCNKHFDVNLEVNSNVAGQRYERQVMNRNDLQIAAYVGLTYKFGHKKQPKADPQPAATDLMDYSDSNNQQMATAQTAKVEEKPVAKQPEPTPAPQPAPAPAELTQNVFFSLASADITSAEMGKVKQLADFLKAHPKANVTLTGYADRETGTSAYNKRLSKQRAEQVARQLEKAGVERSRITVDHLGDTVQPFADNDRNRAVIGKATEK